MTTRHGTGELDAAGVTGALRADYVHCRSVAGRHGRTYFLATRLLTPDRRPAIHALYAFARHADDLVDEPGADPAAALNALEADLHSDRPHRPETRAVRDVIARYDLDPALFAAFLHSMRMDLSITAYADRNAVENYVYGSAAVIGLMVLPVLGTVLDADRVAPYAADLGRAFQLTNFVRDVGEDVDRGRVYLPQSALDAHAVTRQLLRNRVVDHRVQALIADEVAHVRGLYARAEPGIALLAPESRPCVRAAFVLYRDILAAVEANGYDVLTRRARVGRARRVGVAVPLAGRALWARRGATTPTR